MSAGGIAGELYVQENFSKEKIQQGKLLPTWQ